MCIPPVSCNGLSLFQPQSKYYYYNVPIAHDLTTEFVFIAFPSEFFFFTNTIAALEEIFPLQTAHHHPQTYNFNIKRLAFYLFVFRCIVIVKKPKL
jgi:hypothetical protein